MGIIGWIVLGLIAGALAKLIMPGKQGGGIIVTMLLGVVGAFIGGWLGGLLGITGGTDAFSFSIGTLVTAVVGALIVLFVYGLVTKRR